jgi:hypothetical protein
MTGRAAALRPLLIACLLAFAVAACRPPAPPPGPPPPLATSTSLDLETAREQLAERLLASGFSVVQRVGGLSVSTTDPRFASCDVISVRERGSDATRSRLTRADAVTATADIRIEVAGPRTRLSWQTRFSGSYLNRFDNIRFEQPCRSTGELERLLATALPN